MNRLASATSPYLRQHASNPVDWYPWGEEALARARREDRPILLSIGYAACHWCHVMAHESFENAETAQLMSERYVCIKVDREERPDLDGIYMAAVQAMTGHGGWPMTVFLTPAGVPFYGGTYFPPEDRMGMPSFRRVLVSVANAYRERRSDVEQTAEQVREMFARADLVTRRTGTPSADLLAQAFESLAQGYDAQRGGFDGAPKFPQTMALDAALRHWRRTGAPLGLAMARDSFRAMTSGGIYDQVGGGFHRYTVDAFWLVPHFEKMLYDNALLARLGLHLWQATGDDAARAVAEQTLDWVAREMTSPEGGFYASLDADSEGEEGRYYVWSEQELDEHLGTDAPLAKAYWGASAHGNFEGRNILHVPVPLTVAATQYGVEADVLGRTIDRAREALARARAARVPPGRDEKVLAAWNGLMLRTVADCARVLGREDHRAMALRAGAFLFGALVQDGRVRRTPRGGPGYLEDHAALGLAALALYELTFDRAWLQHARALAHAAVEWFWDDAARALYDTARDHERLITRPRDVTDNATPSGTALAVELLLRVADLDDDAPLRERATWVLETLAEPMARHAIAFGHLLGAADLAVYGATEVVLVGDAAAPDFAALEREVAGRYLPSLVLAAGTPAADEALAMLRGREPLEARATAYVCRHYACDTPTSDPAELAAQLERAARA